MRQNGLSAASGVCVSFFLVQKEFFLLSFLEQCLLLEGDGEKNGKLPVFGQAWLRMRPRSRPKRSTGLYGTILFFSIALFVGGVLSCFALHSSSLVKKWADKLKQ
ncbi:hypothetical protein TNCT_182511 [Trichonephila clavata]|uniref:Transmembrane protein n=1 Tax=Trichonephila clavata TaxID=2740835 RepID=A0A8X6LA36_TRICU|nr:hypothetical protein TNCT_182511 [Trichonephila clavata]